MNNNHYPSLELCEKLKDIGFPETENYYVSEVPNNGINDIEIRCYDSHAEFNYPCPSVMEMLDVMPKEIIKKYDNGFEKIFILQILYESFYYYGKGMKRELYPVLLRYEEMTTDENSEILYFSVGTLPNALAEMIIWLVENKHLFFNK